MAIVTVGTPQFVGNNIQYGAAAARNAINGVQTGGVATFGDFLVTQRAAGANLSVDVAPGLIIIPGATRFVGQYSHYDPDTRNVAVSTPNGANPRIDLIVLQVRDNAVDGSELWETQLRTVDGTPTAGANLTNLNGAASIPSNAELVAYVLVGAAASSITNANIRDARRITTRFGNEPFTRIERNANQSFANSTALSLIGMLDAVLDDWGGASLANDRVVINVPGRYRLHHHATWAAVNNTGIRRFAFAINGTAIEDGSSFQPGNSGGNQRMSGSCVMNLQRGDFVQLFAQQNSGGALNMAQATLTVSLVGPNR